MPICHQILFHVRCRLGLELIGYRVVEKVYERFPLLRAANPLLFHRIEHCENFDIFDIFTEYFDYFEKKHLQRAFFSEASVPIPGPRFSPVRASGVDSQGHGQRGRHRMLRWCGREDYPWL